MGTSPHRIDHFLVIFFTFVVMESCISGGSYSVGVCKEEEKQALLCFKNESKIPTNWVHTTDCCSEWDGVVCDNVTGHVIELRPAPNLTVNSSQEGPQFPAWLQSQSHIGLLAISNAEIQDEIPTWFWNFSSSLGIIDVSHNQLRGEIRNALFWLPKDSMRLAVYLGSNQFSGPLPRIPVHMSELDLSNNFFSGDVSSFLCHVQNASYELSILLLGGNGLSGYIPDCWMHWPNLVVINVNENQLIGSMPNSTGLLNILESLDAHMNMLSGYFPPSLQKCTHLLKLDLGENGFTGKIPTWVGTSLSNLTILRLRSNHFFGELPPSICHLSFLHLLDLADNNFFGGIPLCFRNLSGMINIDTNKNEMPQSMIFEIFHESALATTKGKEYSLDITILKLFASLDLSSNKFSGKISIELTNLVGLRSLNLSGNNLTGNIPKEMGNMKLLESLDLSKNKFSGEIPLSFSSLSALGVLDLSYNNLSGKIPSGTQLQGFNASCYIGNNLCGLPLPKNCSVDDGQISKYENEGDDDSDEVDWFYVSMAIGFAVGFWVTCGSLFLVRSWRIAYFQFLDNKFNSILVWARVSYNHMFNVSF
ncbi:receptor-like protein EIX2 [Ipomoea triloba]|uniref:receptor-like protein EIX2 n=1 Tax=Ipomoea triloba TaxID=35885 RepID=UPI00125E3637|nr:receptor-like protein EIX2 [Ipomoea triloba]